MFSATLRGQYKHLAVNSLQPSTGEILLLLVHRNPLDKRGPLAAVADDVEVLPELPVSKAKDQKR
jgi:hypothetical protein